MASNLDAFEDGLCLEQQQALCCLSGSSEQLLANEPHTSEQPKPATAEHVVPEEPSMAHSTTSSTTGTAEAAIPPCLQPIPNMPAEVLLKAAAKQGHRIPDSADAQRKLLAKLSHLHINGLQLHQLHSLRLCPRLQVLYVYDNQLTSISHLAANKLLTHLYAQNNQLQSLEGLQGLALLQKLYLQGNCLSVIDHLSSATRLEELHVSDQQQWRQPPCGSSSRSSSLPVHPTQCAAAAAANCSDSGGLGFDPDTLQAIAGSLKALSMANCGIANPLQLTALRRLHTLDLSHNNISRLDSLQPVLQALQQLRVLDIRQNPCIQHEHKYRDYVILVAADTLVMLDGEDVPQSHREFLLRLHLNKLRLHKKAEQQQNCQQQHQQLKGRVSADGQLQVLPAGCITAQTAARKSDAAAEDGTCAPLSGTAAKLHALRPTPVRPTAAGGFNASGARIAAVLAGPTHPGGSGNPILEL